MADKLELRGTCQGKLLVERVVGTDANRLPPSGGYCVTVKADDEALSVYFPYHASPSIDLRDDLSGLVQFVSQGGMIECHGQVNLQGKPFVMTTVDGVPFGQLAPRDVLNMGTRFIMAAIEAERDAGVVRGMIDDGKTFEEIGEQLTTIRKYRDSTDPDPTAAIFHPRFPHD